MLIPNKASNCSRTPPISLLQSPISYRITERGVVGLAGPHKS